jgi:hypothetical protein
LLVACSDFGSPSARLDPTRRLGNEQTVDDEGCLMNGDDHGDVAEVTSETSVAFQPERRDDIEAPTNWQAGIIYFLTKVYHCSNQSQVNTACMSDF